MLRKYSIRTSWCSFKELFFFFFYFASSFFNQFFNHLLNLDAIEQQNGEMLRNRGKKNYRSSFTETRKLLASTINGFCFCLLGWQGKWIKMNRLRETQIHTCWLILLKNFFSFFQKKVKKIFKCELELSCGFALKQRSRKKHYFFLQKRKWLVKYLLENKI
jgi:hypothetical protein